MNFDVYFLYGFFLSSSNKLIMQISKQVERFIRNGRKLDWRALVFHFGIAGHAFASIKNSAQAQLNIIFAVPNWWMSSVVRNVQWRICRSVSVFSSNTLKQWIWFYFLFGHCRILRHQYCLRSFSSIGRYQLVRISSKFRYAGIVIENCFHGYQLNAV